MNLMQYIYISITKSDYCYNFKLFKLSPTQTFFVSDRFAIIYYFKEINFC